MSLLSGAIMALCMTGLGLYLHLVPHRDLSSVPLVLLLVYVVRTAGTAGLCGTYRVHKGHTGELLSPSLYVPNRSLGP
jgi:hypothetical protein